LGALRPSKITTFVVVLLGSKTLKLSDKLKWIENGNTEFPDLDSYLLDHLNDPTNSPNFRPDNIKDDTFLYELTKIVNSSDSLILSNETIDQIWFLCTAYNIEPEMESFSEDDPAFIVSEIILRNESLKNMKANPKELAYMHNECSSIFRDSQLYFESGADPSANTRSLRGKKRV
jgi:hypothetical protein